MAVNMFWRQIAQVFECHVNIWIIEEENNLFFSKVVVFNRDLFAPNGHLAMTGDSFDCHNQGWGCY